MTARVAPAGRALFVISSEAVSFYAFAALFRDALHCRNALFLDGAISSLHAPDIRRSDAPFPLGPILGVTQPKP